ncbi:putative ferric-chelate reductase KNAG_0E00840 [Huiozyma naganishii CBS 8797]|uniref:Ferric oxidoreductase domain-containing protein n=1 Tax=Huiozyma naganishii (strain ATCC MYA-139 / BCRC 22969 / CBS 8797 / KCTC 17520 / NBRC 10181 / NCYC 3082 / Yp74L-3) TaxID=1071383 RepID=J7RYU1_HUIN7|nr:hypothetical protein KNAG_0E00840 [Kazachstania naganishii CBS 8797]CCK70352.1 hypothetical protein KNAG_0E00840 [Kazachstania naganishii CBS 8797]
MLLNDILRWILKGLPNFQEGTDADLERRRENVTKYTLWCFCFTTLIICFLQPSWYLFSMTRRYFRISYKIKHRLLRQHMWVHRLKIYHNKSLQQFLIWTIVCTVFSVYGARQDLLQITKRFGRVSVALMPPLLFLTLKPSPLPHTLYLTLLPLHKWISRIVVLAAVVHTLLYVYYMHSKGVLLLKMKKLANIYGVAAMALLILIAVTSLRAVRRINFKLFYIVHYLSTWASIFCVYLHARPGVPYYTALNCVVLVGQILYRLAHTSTTIPKITHISPSLTLFEFPLSDLAKLPILPSSHVRIQIRSKNVWKRIFNNTVPLTHPFTLVNLPTEDPVRLLIRTGNFTLLQGEEYDITGTFEPVLNFISKDPLPWASMNPYQIRSAQLKCSPLHYIINAQTVLICVGGSAISFGLPLLRILNFNGVKVRLLWVTRDYRDLKFLNYHKNYLEGLEIYISGNIENDQDLQLDYYDQDDDIENMMNETNFLNTGLTETNALVPNNHNSTTYGSTSDNDEIDFTNSFKRKKSKSQLNLDNLFIEQSTHRLKLQDVFRKSVEVEPPLESPEITKIKIPSCVKVSYGRPKLDSSHLQWCLEKECDSEVDLADNQCPIHEEQDISSALSQVWIVAAGPQGLVENSRRWATDCGLRFHAESFVI